MPLSANTRPQARLCVLVAVLAALLFALAAPSASWAGPSQFDTGFQDPLDPSFNDPDPSHAYGVAKKQHVRYVRVAFGWRYIAPKKPSNPRDFKNQGYHWGSLDARIRGIRAKGMQPILVLFAPPRWAQYGNGETPVTKYFRDFAFAAAKRYNGRGLQPRVRYFQIFNEANIWVYFGKLNQAAHYRALVNAAYKPIHSAAKGNKVIAGGFGPIGGNVSIAPLKMMRQVLSKKTNFDIWSHQPYTSGGPNHRSSHKDDVQIGDLGRMRRVLRAAGRQGKIGPRRNPPFWITEFSWDTKPPDPGGVAPKLHARWVAEAFYRMWQNGVSMVTWFQLRDAPEGQGWGYTWQAGVFRRTTNRYSKEKQKPVGRVIRFPFAATVRGSVVTLWGRTPGSNRKKVVIQRKSGGKWRTVVRLKSGRHGVFVKRRRGLRGKTLRAKAGGTASYPFKAVHTKDKRVRPFGGPLN